MTPEFGAQPLRDAHVSREPILLSIDPGGLRIDCRGSRTGVHVDGEEIQGAAWVDLDRLEAGVALELAGHVVLVAHWSRGAPEPNERFGMLGDSDALHVLLAQIAQAASHDAPVLLRGASGSGKELVAHAIHRASSRSGGPYVSVNVAAISPSTAAAELFGHHRGAFTGAGSAHGGWFGQAEGGTLFLDEIGEAPETVQPMLLRTLETGEVQPVGGQGLRRVSVRVLAATDADLEAAAEGGRFRMPLLHRLGAQTVQVPTLAARKSDIGVLLVHFLERALAEIGEGVPEFDENHPFLPATVVSRALAYSWPGNVRELSNFARELVLTRQGRRSLTVGPTFDRVLPRAGEVTQRGEVAHTAVTSVAATQVEAPREIDDAMLLSALRNNRFRVAATARQLGIAKNTLYQLMDRCAGVRKAKDLSREDILTVQDDCGGDVETMAERLEVSERGLKLRMRELNLG
ncbi:MAG: sigma 54-interacting transcriptional regulator [Polyangiaceae bacterium]